MDLNCVQCTSIFSIQTFKNFHKAVQRAATCRREILHWQSIITMSLSHQDQQTQIFANLTIRVRDRQTVNLTEITKAEKTISYGTASAPGRVVALSSYYRFCWWCWTELKLKTLLLLFICLFTHSQESAVLFLLLLCVVLVLYSYQESTLFVKALDPFNYNKTGCNQYQIWWSFFFIFILRA